MMATNKNTPIRAVVVDDSSTMRELLVSILQNAGGIEIIGTGTNGEEAVRLIERFRPDVLTLDMRMPGMNGLEATRQIMRQIPTPIVIISGSMMPDDIHMTFEALRAGALTMVNKPGLADPETCERVIQTVRQVAALPVVHYWSRRSAASLPGEELSVGRMELWGLPTNPQVIGITASTGGPPALAALLSPLPQLFPLPIVIVHHLTPGFTIGLMEWLRKQTALHVEIASHGDPLRPGTVFLAPDDYHIQINRQGVIELSKGPYYRGLRPSANYLFRSLAQTYGPAALGIALSGLGDDGVEGLEALHRAGGQVLVQEEGCCIAPEMPREVLSRQISQRSLNLNQLAAVLKQMIRKPEPEPPIPAPGQSPSSSVGFGATVPASTPSPPHSFPSVPEIPIPASTIPAHLPVIPPFPNSPASPFPSTGTIPYPSLTPIETSVSESGGEAELEANGQRTIRIHTDVDVIAARTYVRDLARELGMHLRDQARISLAASSLAYGLKLGGTHQGKITMGRIEDGNRKGVQVVCTREGPPCTLEPGALGDTKWMVDELTVNEHPPHDLEVTVIKWLT